MFFTVALLILLLGFFPMLGCGNSANGEDPDPPTPGPPPVGPPPIDKPPVIEPTDTRLSAPVTPAPAETIDALNFAVIREGDLWLGIDNSRLWRQTDVGNIAQTVWSPDGQALALLTEVSWETFTRDLYVLTIGESPVLVAEGITAYSAWRNKEGFLWSPDSSRLAYALEKTIDIYEIQTAAKTSFTIADSFDDGPYWLSETQLLFSVQKPALVIVDTAGTEITRIDNTAMPYSNADGIFAAAGNPGGVDSMYDFYYDSFVFTDLRGGNSRELLKTHVDSCLFALPPGEANRETKYCSLSDAGALFLQKYAGAASAPERIPLLTHDIYLTFSEYSQPFWYAWAPDGNSLVALPFKLLNEGEFGEQEGAWNLVLLNRAGKAEIIQENIYQVKDLESPVPFQTLPINWSPAGDAINFLKDVSDGYDLWQIPLSTKTPSLFLETSGLPDYRP